MHVPACTGILQSLSQVKFHLWQERLNSNLAPGSIKLLLEEAFSSTCVTLKHMNYSNPTYVAVQNAPWAPCRVSQDLAHTAVHGESSRTTADMRKPIRRLSHRRRPSRSGRHRVRHSTLQHSTVPASGPEQQLQTPPHTRTTQPRHHSQVPRIAVTCTLSRCTLFAYRGALSQCRNYTV